jgi:hypothetical protein
LRHTAPTFSSDVPHRTQKVARLTLNFVLFGLKATDLSSYIYHFLSAFGKKMTSVFQAEPQGFDHKSRVGNGVFLPKAVEKRSFIL